MTGNTVSLWYNNFKRRPFGKCKSCNNSIRVTIDISRVLKINNYKNMKYPHVFWVDDNPVCFKCFEALNNNVIPVNTHINYVVEWYQVNEMCYHGNNKYKLCGDKELYDEGLCEQHYNELYEGRVFKKTKFSR